jgi:hypothetical protein
MMTFLNLTLSIWYIKVSNDSTNVTPAACIVANCRVNTDISLDDILLVKTTIGARKNSLVPPESAMMPVVLIPFLLSFWRAALGLSASTIPAIFSPTGL